MTSSILSRKFKRRKTKEREQVDLDNGQPKCMTIGEENTE
jgi:hypothetical protein